MMFWTKYWIAKCSAKMSSMLWPGTYQRLALNYCRWKLAMRRWRRSSGEVCVLVSLQVYNQILIVIYHPWKTRGATKVVDLKCFSYELTFSTSWYLSKMTFVSDWSDKRKNRKSKKWKVLIHFLSSWKFFGARFVVNFWILRYCCVCGRGDNILETTKI